MREFTVTFSVSDNEVSKMESVLNMWKEKGLDDLSIEEFFSFIMNIGSFFYRKKNLDYIEKKLLMSDLKENILL